MILQDWTTSTPSLMIGSEVVEHVDHFTYLGTCTSPNGLMFDGYKRLGLHLPAYTISDVGVISGYQPKDVCTAQKTAPYSSMALKHGH